MDDERYGDWYNPAIRFDTKKRERLFFHLEAVMNLILETIFNILGMLVRFAGSIVFGLAAGWIALDAYRKGGWQLQIAALLGLFALTAVFVRFATAGALGAFALGAGIGILFWGLRKEEKEAEKD